MSLNVSRSSTKHDCIPRQFDYLILIPSVQLLRKERLTICGFKQKEKLPIGKLFLQLFGKEAKSFQQ